VAHRTPRGQRGARARLRSKYRLDPLRGLFARDVSFVCQGRALRDALTVPAVVFGNGKVSEFRIPEREIICVPVSQRRNGTADMRQPDGDLARRMPAGQFA
jgi:hypothetical protein